jgi:ribosome-associated toxin RatA of RatAB toxin-antitoxin module
MPAGRAMETVDERFVRAPVRSIFEIVRAVEHWPAYLPHYRHVRFRERTAGTAGGVGGGGMRGEGRSGGIVEMSANRPFGPLDWPTWWLSQMSVDEARPAVRFRHIDGITTGMDVEWSFAELPNGTQVRLVHAWDGPHWPLIGVFAAVNVIGPIFVHGIASRTIAGLAKVAERG